MIAGGTSSSYEVLARLATGGMAEVFLARVTSEAAIERYVVLKRVLPELAVDEQFVTMFLDEARLAAQLRHPNIAQLYDIGRMGSSYFYTMEYIHGATAWLVMERAAALGTPVPIAHVLTIAGSVAAALHHAHTRVGPDRLPLGIVHRDVTPANIMVSGEGVVKLLDFGVAKAQGRRQVTKIGQVKGKIAYLSPEQCAQTGAIDGRSDIFSLGVVLYEMLTLHQLFQRNNDLATMTAIVHEQVPPPSYLRPEIPRELDGIVMNALAKDPANRFVTADALHQAIEETAARLGISTSITALARYMTSLFGQPPEPWLALEPAPTAGNVTVVSAPLPPLDTTTPAQRMTLPELAARDSADLDERIKHMRDVRPSTPEFDVPTEIEMPPHRPSLPMAAQHPGWEDQTVSLGQAYPSEAIDRTAPEPKTGFDDDPSSGVAIMPPRPLMPSAPYPVIPPSGPMPSAPYAVIPPSGAMAPMLAMPTPAPLYVKPDEDKEWNVKRLVVAALLLLGIVALVLVLVLR